jgi:hypothetical protein
MFLAVGHQKRRLHMSMQQVYSPDHMFDRAAPHLHGSTAALAVASQRDGVVRAISIHTGVYLEWDAGHYEKLEDESQLRLAARIVVAYHDNLRTESEQLSIREAEWSQQETDLLEEACRARMEQWDNESDSEEVAEDEIEDEEPEFIKILLGKSRFDVW